MADQLRAGRAAADPALDGSARVLRRRGRRRRGAHRLRAQRALPARPGGRSTRMSAEQTDVVGRALALRNGGTPSRAGGPSDLADILERVLDKGIVIAGDI